MFSYFSRCCAVLARNTGFAFMPGRRVLTRFAGMKSLPVMREAFQAALGIVYEGTTAIPGVCFPPTQKHLLRVAIGFHARSDVHHRAQALDTPLPAMPR